MKLIQKNFINSIEGISKSFFDYLKISGLRPDKSLISDFNDFLNVYVSSPAAQTALRIEMAKKKDMEKDYLNEKTSKLSNTSSISTIDSDSDLPDNIPLD